MNLADFFEEVEPVYEEEEEPEYPVVKWKDFEVRLLNKHHSLWGERLAECGKIAAGIILDKLFDIDVRGKTILELGAGSGLPSLVAAEKQAKLVVCTDYPDEPLIDNIRYNLRNYQNAKVIGYKWGDDVAPLLQLNEGKKFDILILSDIIFNTSQHKALLRSMKKLMDENSVALCLHTHHRTNKVKEDLQFFDLAENEFNFKLEKVAQIKHPVMFKNDTSNTEEELELRTTAHIHKLYI